MDSGLHVAQGVSTMHKAWEPAGYPTDETSNSSRKKFRAVQLSGLSTCPGCEGPGETKDVPENTRNKPGQRQGSLGTPRDARAAPGTARAPAGEHNALAE